MDPMIAPCALEEMSVEATKDMFSDGFFCFSKNSPWKSKHLFKHYLNDPWNY